MRVGIDLAVLETGFAERGVATYVRGLLSGLARVARDTSFVLFARRPETAEPFLRAGLRGIHAPAAPAGRFCLLGAACGLLRPPVRPDLDVLHSPTLGLPPVRARARTSTLHDLIPLVFPRAYLPRPRDRFLYRTLLRDALSADRLVAVSESTRRDLARRLGVPRARITVIPEAVGEAFRPLRPAQGREAARRLRLRMPFLLHVGGMTVPEPRKDLPLLLEAFRRIAPSRPDLSLVLAGKRGAYAEGIRRRGEAMGLASRLRFPGIVGERDLVALYGLAKVFAFPSRYEGFGLPVLEAMACGAPVVCARSSSLPEVAGDAAVFFDPRDAAGLAAAIERVLEDDALRAELAARGLRRAAAFRWEATARATLALWHEVVGE